MGKDFEIVNGNRNAVANTVKGVLGDLDDKSKGQLIQAAADNFGGILKIAGQMVEIKKMNDNADNQVAELEKKREILVTETENYVKRIEADTNQTLSKAEIFRSMLNDFYKNNNGALSGEEFSGIMKDIIAQIGG